MKGCAFRLQCRFFHRPRHSTRDLLFTILLSALVTACGQEKTDIEYLKSAKNYAEENNTQAFVIELKNALQQNPANAEARYLLGNYYVGQQLGAAAEKEFSKAQEYGWNTADVTLGLIKSYYHKYDYSQLVEKSSDLNALSPIQQAEGFFYIALGYLNLNDTDRAVEVFEKSKNASAESVFGLMSEGYLYLSYNQPVKAREQANAAIAMDPKLGEAFNLAARAELSQRNVAEASALLSQAISLQPNRLQLYIDTARIQLLNGDLAHAEQNIDVVLKQVPRHLPSNLLKASIRLRNKDYEAARVHAEKALELDEINKEAKLISGIANFYLENWEIARNRLISVQNFLNPEHIAHRMLSYADFKLGYHQTAEEVVGSIGSLVEADSDLLMTMGQEFYKEGRKAEAVSLFETAAGLSPDSSQILTRLGTLKLELNDTSGFSILEDALEKDETSYWARVALAKAYLRNNRPEEAAEIAQQLTEQEPNNPDGYILLSEVKKATGDLPGARVTLIKAIERTGDSVELHEYLFKLAIAQKDFKDAAETNRKILEIDQYNARALFNEYRLARQAELPTAPSIKRFIEAIDDVEDPNELRLLLALAYIDSEEIQNSVEQLKAIETNSSFYNKAQNMLGGIYYKQQDYANAIVHYQKLVRQAPKDLKAHQALAMSFLRQGDSQAALDVIQNALGLFPANKSLGVSYIKLLLETDRTNKAEQEIRKYTSTYSPTPELDFMLGRYFAANQDYPRALSHFQALHKVIPSSKSAVAMAELYHRMGNENKMRQLTDDWLKENPQDQAVILFLANLDLKSDQRKAIQKYRAILEKDANNVIALNNLAWTLSKQGELTEAVSLAERAYAINPNLPAVADTYGYLLLLSGDSVRAEEILLQARNSSNNDASIIYHHALALKQKGLTEEARQSLKIIIDQDFPEKQDAVKVYNTL